MSKKSRMDLFKRLTRLFRSGPVIRRKIRSLDTAIVGPDKTSSGVALFQKSTSPTYANITANAYNLSERLMRYQDFQEMEQTPEISCALDIIADEVWASDDKGRALHVYSDDPKIKSILDDLFYQTLNIDFNGRPWTRNLVKYGDLALYNDVSPDYGVVNVFPIPINEIEREEGYDKEDPFAVRFRWLTLGNRVLENWEVSHFRLLGNDQFLPYGSSMIEPARRIWRQLILIEDAMLVYRIVRAPERRVFYIDVGNAPPEDIPLIIEEQKKTLKTQVVTENASGRIDLRYNPTSVDEDYYIGVRGQETGTKIDTLKGGENTAAVEDVEYIQRKLIASLKVPRPYLGFEEVLSSRGNLAQQDIRFSRTVAIIQKTMIAELNKLAIIQLYCNGYDGDDLVNFTLKLSNPSTVAEQQKLELWRAKFDIVGNAPEKYVTREFVQQEILNLSDEQIEHIDERRVYEAQIDASIENVGGGDEGGGGGGGGGGSLFGGGGEGGPDLGALGGEEGGGGEGGGEMPEMPEMPEEPAGGEEEIEAGDDQGSDEERSDVELLLSVDDEGPLVNVSPHSKSVASNKQYNAKRRSQYRMGNAKDDTATKSVLTQAPNKKAQYQQKRQSSDMYDFDGTRQAILGKEALERSSGLQVLPSLSEDVISALRSLDRSFGSSRSRQTNRVLTEDTNVESMYDSIMDDDDD